jgi:nitrate/nitrite transporter NarK
MKGFLRYLRAMPLRPLLLVIGIAVTARMAIGHAIEAVNPQQPLWLNYLYSMIPALALALAVSWILYRRAT